MAVSAEKRSSRVRRQASKKQRKNRTVQVRFSDEELAALDAVCESTGMTRSAVLRSWTVPGEGAGSNPVYVVTKNADAERLAMELCGTDNVRDVVAFPKNLRGAEPMSECPSAVPQEDLDVLGLKIAGQGEKNG